MTIRESLEILGLTVDASPEEAKVAYRTLAKALHSDLHHDKSAEQRDVLDRTLRRINKAYERVEGIFKLPVPDRERVMRNEERAAAAASSQAASAAASPAATPEDEQERKARERAYAAQRRAEENIRAARRAESENRSVRVHRRRSNATFFLTVGAVLCIAGVIALFVFRPHLGFDFTPVPDEQASAVPIAPSPGESVPAPTEAELAVWSGKSVAVAACRNEAACANEDCAAIPLLRSLKNFYGIENAFVLYGSEESASTMAFYEVVRGVRTDRFSIVPRIVVPDSPGVANRRVLGRTDPKNSCKFSFGGPIGLTRAAGSLPPEVRLPKEEREAVLQLDELESKAGAGGTLTAGFIDVENEKKLQFVFGPRREGIEGPVIPDAPAFASDIGSLYRVRFQRVDFQRGDQIFTTNHEFLKITRISGEKESAQFRNVPLISNPKTVIRRLERLDLASIRGCQSMTSDPGGYQRCTMRLIDLLQRVGRMEPSAAEDLRGRMREMSID